MKKVLKNELIEYLQEFITHERWKTLQEVLENRTRYLTVVLEDIYQPHNASAVLRSCDCFGIQDVHVVENKNEFDPSKGVTIGADKWISLHSYNQPKQNNTERCYEHLRKEGYSIIATTPHHNDVTIDEISLDQKTALVFGAEYTGLSEFAMEAADGYAKIPMVGFSESFNISVGAAICLYELSTRLRKTQTNWQLSDDEKTDLQLEWLKKSIRASEKIVEKFMVNSGL
jgi:tRNA (guanosine-2'-O-)-methyltransferase